MLYFRKQAGDRLVNRYRRAWFLIAIVAIGLALLLMLLAAGHASGHGGWLAILPIVFAGIISPLTLFPSTDHPYQGRFPDAPALPAISQRPPPFRVA